MINMFFLEAYAVSRYNPGTTSTILSMLLHGSINVNVVPACVVVRSDK